MIYFIQPVDGGLIKIGYANKQIKRMAELQRMSPLRLKLLTVIDGGREKEAAMQVAEWHEAANAPSPVIAEPVGPDKL